MSFITSNKHSWAVVLAGGDGKRLQELAYRLSGDRKPKQFCHFFGGKSLLGHTRDRIAPLFLQDRTLFMLTRTHENFYREELAGVSKQRLMIQPANRGTALAFALCLCSIAERDEDAIVTFLPSDHYYSCCSSFQESVASGLRLIDEYPDSLLIMGAEARYPEVEYGWIQPGRTLVESRVNPLQRVSRFWEKPELKRAQLLHHRGCLWNTFITMGRVGAFLELLDATVPELMGALRRSIRQNAVDRLYDSVTPVDFSQAVLTRAPERLVVLRDTSGWTDLGNPRRVAEVLLHQGMQLPWLEPHGAEERQYAFR